MVRLGKNTTKAIRKWLAKYGYTVGCRLNREFLYEPDDNYIGIQRVYDSLWDTDFMACLRGLGMKSNFDTITLSILHELGHYETMPDFTEEEWENDNILKQILIDSADNQHELNIKYWATSTEKVANEWAVYMADNRSKQVQELEDIIAETMERG